MPNKFHKQSWGYFLLQEYILYFVAHNICMNLVKSQIPSGYCVRVSSRLLEICLATIGVCVFSALTLVDALFLGEIL